jgi:circadian clock protein KaiC
MLTDLKKGEPRERTEEAISSLVDTWLVLRDIESNGERNRGLHILKSRGTSHSNQVREFFLSDTGVQIADVYIGPNGMLTGSARVAQEARERAEHVSLNEEAERQNWHSSANGPRSKGRSPRCGPSFSAEEATIARIFRQDKQREESVALDRVAMGRSRQHDTVKGNGSPARRNVTGGKQL